MNRNYGSGNAVKSIKVKLSSILAAFILSLYSLASQSSEIGKFYSKEHNQKAFELAESSGKINAAREQWINGCLQNQGKNKANCNCREELDKVTNKEFYYESMLAFQQYQEKVAALKNNDQEKLEKLRKSGSEHKGWSKRLENKCGKI